MPEPELPLENPADETEPSDGESQTKREPAAKATPNMPRRQRRADRSNPTTSTALTNQGADLERRVARIEFSDGALVRLRQPIRVPAESGRDVLTDIDVLAVDVDNRLRVTRSILECKSGKGQAGEPDRLLWLSGLQRYLGFERAVLVRQTVSRRGRGLGATLGVGLLDVRTLGTREVARAWVPARFAHVDGPHCVEAERRTDIQLKGLGHLPTDAVAFLRHDALRAKPHECLRAVSTVGRSAAEGGVLPTPAREVLAGHALTAVALAAIIDAGSLDDRLPEQIAERTARALTTGSPEGSQVLELLGRADQLTRHLIERVHAGYQTAGAARIDQDVPELRHLVSAPPAWVPRYVDLVEKFRANSNVTRDLLQVIDLTVFDALLGGDNYRAPAFDRLFSAEHRYLLDATLRCAAEIAGGDLLASIGGVLALDFERAPSTSDHDKPAE